MALKIGYKASAEQFGPRDLVEYSVLAEDVGLDSVMVSDHYQPWRHTGGHAPFSMAWMSAVGERTSRIVLGTSVLTATFRYNPAIVAQAFWHIGLPLSQPHCPGAWHWRSAQRDRCGSY